MRRKLFLAPSPQSRNTRIPRLAAPKSGNPGATSRHIDAIYQHTLPTIAYFRTQPV
ncbi:hypothetical protein [Nostoc sp.]|uniref:hypothetical protein n=1 Tax=Nostoc sp. TaxID=1180 RepID=UPI002FFC064A